MLSKSLLPGCQRNSERWFSLLMPSLNCGDSLLGALHSSRNVGSISHIPYVPMGEKNTAQHTKWFSMSAGRNTSALHWNYSLFKQIDNSFLSNCWLLAEPHISPCSYFSLLTGSISSYTGVLNQLFPKYTHTSLRCP